MFFVEDMLKMDGNTLGKSNCVLWVDPRAAEFCSHHLLHQILLAHQTKTVHFGAWESGGKISDKLLFSLYSLPNPNNQRLSLHEIEKSHG